MKSFLSRFGSMISFVLSGFDRLRFCGESRLLNNARGVDSYLYQQKVRYVDAVDHFASLTKTLSKQTIQAAAQEGVPLQHLNSAAIDKEALALELAHRDRSTAIPAANPTVVAAPASGRIAVFSCVESCSTYRLRKNTDGLLKPRKEQAKCLHYYHYFLHPQLGLLYVRVQSWFPFTVRVGMNGRQWLYRQLENRGIAFERRRNLLLSVANPEQAQEILDQQRRTDWTTTLDDLVRPLQPLTPYLYDHARTPYHWMTEQSEWATDFMFREPADLAVWYPRFVRHGLETLGCKDVLRFLGKKVPENSYGNCTGEVKIDARDRGEGTRVKFWYNTDSLKMYDKDARGFRVEATVNHPQGFKVFRNKEGEDENAPKKWRPMRKGVADFDRRAEVSDAANRRLIESLATVAETKTFGALLKPLGQPVMDQGKRKARALNPTTGPDGALLRTLAQGEWLINGFRNRDLRETLHGACEEPAERRRQAAQVTRQLTLLRAHGLIVKVPKTHRYHLSASGRRVATVLLAAQACDVSRLTSNS